MTANGFYCIAFVIYFFAMLAYCYLAIKDYNRTMSIISDIKNMRRVAKELIKELDNK